MDCDKTKGINLDAILKLVILWGYAFFFFITIQTGKIELFVHPRIVPYMNFGIAALLMISLFVIGDVFKPQKGPLRLMQYLFFIIPLIMALTLPVNDVSSKTMSFGNMGMSDIVDNTEAVDTTADVDRVASETPSDTDALPADSTQNTVVSASGGNQQADKGFMLQEDTVVIDDDNFIKWVGEISDNPSKYVGKKIKVKGFVFRDKQFKSNEFVPARLMMTCCAADVSPVGLLAHYKGASELKQDSWFVFSGKIIMGEYMGQKMPMIEVDSMENTEKPQNEYVYPY